MPTKHIILLAYCVLIVIITFATFNIHTPRAFSARVDTYSMYYRNNEKRIIYPPNGIVTIIISASTNTCGITMNLHYTGSITYKSCYSSGYKMLPLMLAHTFFNDIRAAWPLNKLPREGCIKSTSFGTTTRIKFQMQESPDVSCSTDLRGMKLNADVQAIQQALHIIIP